ncbi:protein kinase STUNTED-like [Malania oleifera]|uniref:protein kinase STUNTED-like n=1 Tax=Malania oleifera TaxID=397392 RepID=UPI0025AE07FA|nr:protein kinase STUNTED-like [Malania oleifera]XP_057966478.1 protein kinase STUNTED-like [Malania oleifera]XP_057966479.1 protein kinase STUNTED-like [Malania oleifera]XP_057966480.1 protein kinase STUNTED-like [Malania oleifera]
MTVDRQEVKAVEKRSAVLVGILIDSTSRELLNWALVKVAEPGDRVLAIHVCRESGPKNKALLDDYLEDYEGLCHVKQVELTGKALSGSSIRKVLVREAKKYAAAAVVLGISRQNALRGWASKARYCAKQLPLTTEVLAIHDGKVIFRSFSRNLLPGLGGDPKPSICLIRNSTVKENSSEYGDSEASETEKLGSEVVQSFEKGLSNVSEVLKDDCFSFVDEHRRVSARSVSLSSDELSISSEQSPGWPLLQRAISVDTSQALGARNMSVVQWVMTLPNRSPLETTLKGRFSSNNKEIPLGGKTGELVEKLKLLLSNMSSMCQWFSYEVLKNCTSNFSSENLIGRGVCSRVYKGVFPNGKPVAVKILKSSKEAWKDFVLEVEIISSLKHKSIMPLLGICIEDNDLIFVYDYLSKGSLEKNLHDAEEKSVLSWEVRFNIALQVAEALSYLHEECSRPVIHRDIKSSNILLSSGFEPQLSDFGLAIWAPTTSYLLTQGDIVGTFGYLAPEYFMYGKISDKIDVYSFGVVLLELLSGRKPIGSETSKAQESLVMWAKPILESGDPRGILDPNLNQNFDEVQVQRMVLGAALCITRTARLRPRMSQILKILRGEEDVSHFVISQPSDQEVSENLGENDDEVYPDSSVESHLSLAFLDVDDDSTSLSSVEQSNSIAIEEYFKMRSRSSSFN